MTGRRIAADGQMGSAVADRRTDEVRGAPVRRRRFRAPLGAFTLAGAALMFPVVAAGAGEAQPLAGGEALGRGIFATYSDQDTVIEGGTVAAPDFSSPLAHASLDLTGLGSGLASLGYSPYNDAAGVVNAFAGTGLPLDSFSNVSRAKVTGSPPQEQKAAAPGPPGSAAWARLREGPTVEAVALAFATPAGPPMAVRIGDVRSTVRRAGSTVGSTVSVVLGAVTIGDVLTIESITLTASAAADGAAGRSVATCLVEGVTVAGRAMRFTPAGVEPVGAAAPDLGGLGAAGIEILSSGGTTTTPGGNQSEAQANGPRIRFRTADGRTVTLVLGEARVSSSFVPPTGG